MAVQTSAGSGLWIGTTAINLLTDTYINVNEITNLGQFGRSYDEIKHSNLLNRNVVKFKGQRDDGDIQLDLGRFSGDAGQAAMRVALDIDADYNFKVTLNDPATLPIVSVATMTIPAIVETVTCPIAAPAVFTGSVAAPAAGTPCVLTSTGTVPAGFTSGTTYFVIAPSGNTFELAATVGGSPIASTTAGTGTITATLTPPSIITIGGTAPPAGTPFTLVTTGVLPTGFVFGQTYYVLAPSGSTFQAAATPGGLPIGGSGTQSGVMTAQLFPGTPTTFYFKAKVMSYQTTVGPPNQVVSARTMLGITSGSIIEVAPT